MPNYPIRHNSQYIGDSKVQITQFQSHHTQHKVAAYYIWPPYGFSFIITPFVMLWFLVGKNLNQDLVVVNISRDECCHLYTVPFYYKIKAL